MRQDDENLMRYADGELNAVARARVERAAAEDVAVAARLEEHRKLKARLSAHYGPVAEEEVPQRLTSLLTGNVVGISRGHVAAKSFRWIPVAIAASLAAGVFVGQMLPRGAGSPVSFDGGAMIAGGEVARALDTQLASVQTPGSTVRIGVSFPGEGGRACRTFEVPAMAGVACRVDARWQVLVTAPGVTARSAGRYRQAGATHAIVMQAAQDMMSGEPLDAAAERRARDDGWMRNVGEDVGRR